MAGAPATGAAAPSDVTLSAPALASALSAPDLAFALSAAAFFAASASFFLAAYSALLRSAPAWHSPRVVTAALITQSVSTANRFRAFHMTSSRA